MPTKRRQPLSPIRARSARGRRPDPLPQQTTGVASAAAARQARAESHADRRRWRQCFATWREQEHGTPRLDEEQIPTASRSGATVWVEGNAALACKLAVRKFGVICYAHMYIG